MLLDTMAIRCTLAERGLTQKDLAKAAGISPQSISIILKVGSVKTVTAGKLAKALNCDVRSIIKEG